MMRTRQFATTAAAAVLALAVLGGVAPRVRAGGPPTSTSGLTRDVRRDEPARDEASQQGLFDQLDDARTNRDLLEIEVETDREQIRKMLSVLRATELQMIQGFSLGPVISGNDEEDRESRIAKYKNKFDEVRVHFIIKSKELGRERRRVAALEGRLGIKSATSAASPLPATASAERSWRDAERVLDLILRGVESWQRGTSPARRPAPEDRLAPEDRAREDADRILDLIRRGMDSWRRDPEPPPPPEAQPAPVPPPEERPAPPPEDRPLKDAERLLELILRGVESWQRQ